MQMPGKRPYSICREKHVFFFRTVSVCARTDLYTVVRKQETSELIAASSNNGLSEQVMGWDGSALCLPPGVLAGPEVGLHPRDEEDLAVVDVGVNQGQRL
jgi:hypothetical protein